MDRMKRVNALIKQEVADIIQKKLDNANVGFISITEVDVSKDLRNAKVYYSQIGSVEEKEATFTALKKTAKFIKGELGRVLRMKNIPDLFFVFDDSIEKGVDMVNKINNLS